MSREARALIVDDDAAIRFMVGKILEREGFAVDHARDGYEAIEKIRNNDYAFVLLDLMMPRVDGFHVLQRLNEEDPERLNRVVVMTALSPDHVVNPVPHIIHKPFDLELLTSFARHFRDSSETVEELAG